MTAALLDPVLYNQKAVIIKKFRLITSHKDCILNLGDDFVVIINNKPISPGCNRFLVFLTITNVLYKHSYSSPKKYNVIKSRANTNHFDGNIKQNNKTSNSQ